MSLSENPLIIILQALNQLIARTAEHQILVVYRVLEHSKAIFRRL